MVDLLPGDPVSGGAGLSGFVAEDIGFWEAKKR